MSETRLTEIADALFDGGWRAKDRWGLIREYDFTNEEADAICDFLTELEKEAEE